MTTTDYSPLLRNGSSRTSTTQHHLPIHAHYFDITDIESWPIAGLLVLLDGQAQPVRAELHLYDGLEAHVQDAAIRQVRLVLQERYLGGEPVPVRILETLQVREEMQVRLPPLGARPMSVQTLPWARWRPYGLIAGAVVALLLVVWMISALVNSSGDAGENVAATTTPEVAGQPAEEIVDETSSDAAVELASVDEVASLPTPSGVELPLSRNARGDLGIGMQVVVVPGLQLALRTEPGVDRGDVLGAMTEEDTATIIAGPEYTEGDADTIVWWYVELADGTQAWAAANTSQQTLLMPAQ